MRIKVRMFVTDGKYKPVYKTIGSAGMDLRARIPEGVYVLEPNEIHKFNTGVHIELPEDFVGLMRPRSGLSLADIDSKAGTIDCDYRGEMGIIVKNNTDSTFIIADGDRIAQMIIVECAIADIGYVDNIEELSETFRGNNGFGHTGLK